MTEIFLIDGIAYNTDKLGESGLKHLSMVEFILNHITEVQSKQKILMDVSNSYRDSLKNEILMSKSGLLFEDN
jgi:hypothetical protein